MSRGLSESMTQNKEKKRNTAFQYISLNAEMLLSSCTERTGMPYVNKTLKKERPGMQSSMHNSPIHNNRECTKAKTKAHTVLNFIKEKILKCL